MRRKEVPNFVIELTINGKKTKRIVDTNSGFSLDVYQTESGKLVNAVHLAGLNFLLAEELKISVHNVLEKRANKRWSMTHTKRR